MKQLLVPLLLLTNTLVSAAPSDDPAKLPKGHDYIELRDGLAGEVWLASGQSNMHFNFLQRVTNGEKALAESDDPWVRQFTVVRTGFASVGPARMAGSRSHCPGFRSVDILGRRRPLPIIQVASSRSPTARHSRHHADSHWSPQPSERFL